MTAPAHLTTTREISTHPVETQPSTPIRIILVDDHLILRDILRNRLQEEAHFQIVATCGDGVEALAAARQYSPDVMLLDIEMPQLDGVEVTRILKRELPSVRVIALTALDGDDVLMDMMSAGADGFCPKTVDVATLIKAIELVAQGATFLPPETSCRLRLLMQQGILSSQSPPPSSEQAPVNLTQREVEILQWVTQGLSNAEIGERTHISINTVRCHIKNILTKFNVHDRVQAVNLARQQGLLP
ncbi:MAG: response regulator [Cyanophyceae cyanobacterium]